MSETPEDQVSRADQIEQALSGIPVDRTRPSSKLKRPEVQRLMDIIRPVVEQLETELREALEQVTTVPEGPTWMGITYPQSGDLITADRKNAVYTVFLEREGLLDRESQVLGTSIRDNDLGKRVYYFYSAATDRGPVTFYIVHRDYTDYLPPEVQERAGITPSEASEPPEEESPEDSEEEE